MDIKNEINPLKEGKYVRKSDAQWALVTMGIAQLDIGREVLGYILIGVGVVMRIVEILSSLLHKKHDKLHMYG